MDPQLRLLLEVTHEAIVDAGNKLNIKLYKFLALFSFKKIGNKMLCLGREV